MPDLHRRGNSNLTEIISGTQNFSSLNPITLSHLGILVPPLRRPRKGFRLNSTYDWPVSAVVATDRDPDEHLGGVHGAEHGHDLPLQVSHEPTQAASPSGNLGHFDGSVPFDVYCFPFRPEEYQVSASLSLPLAPRGS